MARPTLLTDDLLTNLEGIVEDGITITDACEALGISDQTWRDWEARGAADDEAGRETDHSKFLGLATRVRVRRKRKVTSALYRIATASPSEAIPAAAIVSASSKWLTLIEKEAPVQEIRTTNPGLDLSKLSEQELRDLHRLTAKAEGDAT